jgi:hypothetical protein
MVNEIVHHFFLVDDGSWPVDCLQINPSMPTVNPQLFYAGNSDFQLKSLTLPSVCIIN